MTSSCLRVGTLIVAVGMSLCARSASAQETRIVVSPPTEVASRLISGQPVDYPKIAQAGSIEYAVRVQFVHGPDGQVESTEVLSGHPMLNSAAVIAIRTWRFRPLIVDGQAVRVRTIVTVPFFLNADSKVRDGWRAYGDVAFECELAIGERRFETAMTVCENARTLLMTLPGRGSEESRVFSHLAEANAGMARFEEAISLYRKALPPSSSGYSSIASAQGRMGLGRALRATGNLEDASNELDRADKGLRDIAGRSTFAPDIRARATALLRQVLTERAELLDQLKKPRDAARLRERLGKL